MIDWTEKQRIYSKHTQHLCVCLVPDVKCGIEDVGLFQAI